MSSHKVPWWCVRLYRFYIPGKNFIGTKTSLMLCVKLNASCACNLELCKIPWPAAGPVQTRYPVGYLLWISWSNAVYFAVYRQDLGPLQRENTEQGKGQYSKNSLLLWCFLPYKTGQNYHVKDSFDWKAISYIQND